MVSFQASIFRCKLAVNLSFEATDPSLARFGITSIPVQQIYREKIKHNHPKNQPGLLETGDTTQNPSKYRSKLLFFTSSFLEGQMILRAKLNQSSLLQLVKPAMYPTSSNYLVVSTHFKNMVVKLHHFPRLQGENSKKN